MKNETKQQGPTVTKERQTDNQTRATFAIREAAGILGIGKNQAYAAARSGELPTIRIGGRILVSRAALERMLQGEV